LKHVSTVHLSSLPPAGTYTLNSPQRPTSAPTDKMTSAAIVTTARRKPQTVQGRIEVGWTTSRTGRF